jgi:HlyD family secretion protein
MSLVTASTPSSPPSPARVSLDQLDKLVRVTTVHGWVYLFTLFAVCAAATAFAVCYQVRTKVNGEGILLIDRDTLSQVRARGTGRLISLKVQLGDPVAPGDQIGEISQNELEDAILEAKSKLSDVEREDQELTRHEQQERDTQTKAIERVRRAIHDVSVTSRDLMKIAESIAESDFRLRVRKYLGDAEMLESREKLYVIKDDLNKGQSRLAEMDLEATKGEIARHRAQLERRLKIQQLKTRLELDRAKFLRTSRIVSEYHGRVVQVLSASGELVREGSPVVMLDGPKSEREADADESPYESIIFVPAGEGKKIDLGDAVEVSPATVKREEHGFIRGRVAAIWEMPATKLAMEAALQHPELAEAFLKRYAPGVLLRIHVKLDEPDDSNTDWLSVPPSKRRNRYLWSTSSGGLQPLKTGTMCQAAIVVEQQRLIKLILPWTKKSMGAD